MSDINTEKKDSEAKAAHSLKEEKILKLVELGRQKGTLSYQEIGDALEDIDLKSEQLDALYDAWEALSE